MSIVNLAGERIILDPRASPVRPVRSPKIRKRNLRWLALQRQGDLTTRELARRVRMPRSTVGEGLRWATDEEERLEELAIAAERSPVLHAASGLTLDDLIFLITIHPPGTPLGDHERVQDFLTALVREVITRGLVNPPAELVESEAA